MENLKKRNARHHKWDNEHYDKIFVQIPKGQKEMLKALADERGLTIPKLISKIATEEIPLG